MAIGIQCGALCAVYVKAVQQGLKLIRVSDFRVEEVDS
jgi:hypothetical protein